MDDRCGFSFRTGANYKGFTHYTTAEFRLINPEAGNENLLQSLS